MDSNETIFNKVLGAIISLAISKDYCGYLSAVYDERDEKYMRNKFSDVEKSQDKLIKAIGVNMDTARPEVKEMIEFNSNLIFDSLSLSVNNQNRVYSLIKKLAKEEKQQLNNKFTNNIIETV